MGIIVATMLVVAGGMLNGSFAIPKNKITGRDESRIWFYFSFWAYLIVPTVTFLILDPHVFTDVFHVPLMAILMPLVGGFIWGIGMALFSVSFKYVGLAVAFAINIGMGTAGGALLPLVFLHPDKLITWFGMLVCLGVLAFIIGVVLAAFAAKERNKGVSQGPTNHTQKGIIFAVLAGIGSICQGFAFAFSTGQYVNSPLLAHRSLFVRSNLPWYLVFLGAFLPYMLYFLYSFKREEKLGITVFETEKTSMVKVYFITMIMGALFFECLVLYGFSTGILGDLGPVIAYPIFMVFIVLTSNFWGIQCGEWHGANKKSKKMMKFSIAMLVIAVLFQTLSVLFQ